MNEIQKKKKRIEQLATLIKDKEAEFNKLIEESKKILELVEKEYDNTISKAEIKLNKSKKDVILEAGHYLEKNLEIVPNNSPNYICRKLKDTFKGIINPTTIWYHSPDTWKDKTRADLGRKGAAVTNSYLNPRWSDSSKNLNSSVETEPLTKYEQKYVELHEEKVNRNEHIVALIDDFLGLTESEKTEVFKKVKKVGTPYHNALIDEAYNNMLRIVKSLNDADIPALLGDIRFLKQILTKVSDMALAEHEQRKRKKEMTGQ